jgi:hypothetical protein
MDRVEFSKCRGTGRLVDSVKSNMAENIERYSREGSMRGWNGFGCHIDLPRIAGYPMNCGEGDAIL